MGNEPMVFVRQRVPSHEFIFRARCPKGCWALLDRATHYYYTTRLELDRSIPSWILVYLVLESSRYIVSDDHLKCSLATIRWQRFVWVRTLNGTRTNKSCTTNDGFVHPKNKKNAMRTSTAFHKHNGIIPSFRISPTPFVELCAGPRPIALLRPIDSAFDNVLS